MRVHSLCRCVFLLSLLLAVVSLCSAEDKTFVVVGTGECADCKENTLKTSQAFSGLGVTIDCKLKNGEIKRISAGELDKEGKFEVSIPQGIVQDDHSSLKHECYAQLHSAAVAPCPAINGVESSKIVFKSQTNGKLIFAPSKNLQFSTALCTSKFLWPYYKYPPLPKIHPWKKHFFAPPIKNFGHPFPLPPFPFPPVVKPLPPPVPVYKPPMVKPVPPPVPVYKPPVVKPIPPPAPVSKPKPKPPVVKPLPPPVPVYKPKPKPKPEPPVVKPLPPPKPPVSKPPKKPCPPTVKPKPKPPVVKPHPPPVPIYKPKPPVVKPLPPPAPVYKPPPVVKPLPPPTPVYQSPPVVNPLPPPTSIYPFPPFHKKPCPPLPQLPPLPKLPPFPKIPPKYFHHPKIGYFPPLPPSIPHP